MRTLLDLILPQACGGCEAPGSGWCPDCAVSLAGPPLRIRPRTDPGVPCWALSGYGGPGRRAVVAAKESGRRDLAAPLGLALARGLDRLRDRGRPLVLVPAPSRRAAARRRGGDPVRRSARIAAGLLDNCTHLPLLWTRADVRDSVGLGASARRRNLHNRIMIARGPLPSAVTSVNSEVVLVDDVLTTGATATESIRVLTRAGADVRAVVVTCGTGVGEICLNTGGLIAGVIA